MSSVQAAWVTEEMDWQDWRVIDRELRKVAGQRGQLDANEAFLLCCASRQEIWRKVGRASFLEYLEDVLGYTPKCARERLRVACALDAVPEIAEALATGEQSYSAVRELTRVATPETQAAWREAARGKNVRQIEELVSVHAPGDQPSDPPRPDLKPHRLSFEVSPATFARLRQTQQVLAKEHGAQLDDDALVETLCAAVLDGGSGEADQGRARHQVMTTICDACLQGWQQGGGRQIAVTATDVEMVECDAQWIGSDREPARAKQDITPKVRRHVWHRDHGNCTVDGCRSSRNIDVHHIVPRYLGGGHEAENLTLLCSGHHRSLHNGALQITGRAPDLAMRWKLVSHVGHQIASMSHVGRPAAHDGASPSPERHDGTAASPHDATPSSWSQAGQDKDGPNVVPHVGHATARHVMEQIDQARPASKSTNDTPHVGHAAPRHAAPQIDQARPASKSTNDTPHVGQTTPRHAAPQIDKYGPASKSTNGTPHVGHTAARHVAPQIANVRTTLSSVSTAPDAGRPKPPLMPSSSSSNGRSTKYERVVMKTEAIQALTTAGFHRSLARTFVEDALADAPADVTLEKLLVMALQRSRTD